MEGRRLLKIRFRQSGGLAGLVRGCELTPEALSPKERAEFERLLGASHLLDSPPPPAAPASRERARDLLQISIEIESASGTTHLGLDDLDLPEHVAPFVAFLQKHARPVPLNR